MILFNRVVIIGLGLIGGSLGLVIKDKRLAKEVIGISRRKSTIQKALAMKAVDNVTLDLKKGVKGADLVIIAAPVFKIVSIAKIIAPLLKKGAILTDAGSTKRYIVSNIEKIVPGGLYFVGSHPMAGSEKSGVVHADKNLFKGAFCVLTKTKNTNPTALNKIKRFWSGLGMKVVIMSPKEHDKAVSRISHLPHSVAISLVNSLGQADLRLAAGGLKDTTRIASGEAELWKDIFLTNRENLIKDIRVFRKELSKVEYALKNNGGARLLKILSKAKFTRDTL